MPARPEMSQMDPQGWCRCSALDCMAAGTGRLQPRSACMVASRIDTDRRRWGLPIHIVCCHLAQYDRRDSGSVARASTRPTPISSKRPQAPGRRVAAPRLLPIGHSNRTLLLCRCEKPGLWPWRRPRSSAKTCEDRSRSTSPDRLKRRLVVATILA